MAISFLIFALVFGYIQVSDATTTYSYVKVTNTSCGMTKGEFDVIGGLQKDEVTHDECRGNCTKYDWCYGIRITYEGAVTGKRKKRGVHSEKCRLLTPGADIEMDGWTHYNANRWADWPDWKDSAYSGYNCYRKKASTETTTTTTTTSTTTTSTTTSTSTTSTTTTSTTSTTSTSTTSTTSTSTTSTTTTTATPPIFCGPDASPMHVEMCSLCTPLNDTGCKGDCKFSAMSTCVPKDYIDCGMKNFAESCSLCTPYNASGCATDCKWSKASTCIPVDHVYCGNMIYAESCDKCPLMTGMNNATGCEAVDGDCKWMNDTSICAPRDPVAEATEKLRSLMERLNAIEPQVSANTENAEMNRKRHQNVDITFNKLCPLIDQVFDVESSLAPGKVSYDCCYESFNENENSDGKVGQSMLCLTNTLLGLMINPPFEATATGSCASTCGSLSAELAGK